MCVCVHCSAFNAHVFTYLFVIAMHDDINLESFVTKFMFTISWSSTNKKIYDGNSCSMQCMECKSKSFVVDKNGMSVCVWFVYFNIIAFGLPGQVVSLPFGDLSFFLR